jgi:hypothetical protein
LPHVVAAPPPVPPLPPPVPPLVHAPAIGSHAMPEGQVPQPLSPQVPSSGTQTCAWVPSSATATRQLSPVWQSAVAVHVSPQKSLPAYCTQTALDGQSEVVLHVVQVAAEPLLHAPAEHV